MQLPSGISARERDFSGPHGRVQRPVPQRGNRDQTRSRHSAAVLAMMEVFLGSRSKSSVKAVIFAALFFSSAALSPIAGCKKEVPASPAPTAAAVSPAPSVAAPPGPVAAPPTDAGGARSAPGGSAPPVVEPPVTAPACRALMLLATPSQAPVGEEQAPPLVPPTSYTVLDVTFGDATTVKQAPGLLVREGGRTFSLSIERTEKRGKSGENSFVDTWDRLMAVDLASGKKAVWYEQKADSEGAASAMVEGQDPEEVEPGDFDAQRLIDVIGVVGPVVSFFAQDTGFTGGAHGNDDTSVVAIRAPSGEVQQVSALLPDLSAAAARHAAIVDKRREVLGEDDGFDPSSITAQTLAAVGIGVDPSVWVAGPLSDAEIADRAALPLGLYAYTRVQCCSWAENHNLLDLSIPVAMPDALAQLTGRTAPGPERLLLAQDGCGAVGLKSGMVLTRKGREGSAAVQQLQGPAPVSLLGVYWIDAKDPIDIAKLPNPLVIRQPD